MSTHQAPTFETLPKEIRDAIYELCLIFDKEIIPNPHEHERKACEETSSSKDGAIIMTTLPGILQANHSIAEEAAAIFCGKNTFRLSRIHADLRKPSFWTRYSKHLKRVKAVFDVRDVGNAALMKASRNYMTKARASRRKATNPQLVPFDDPEEVKEQVHEKRLELLACLLEKKSILLAKMDLTTLILEVGNLTCPGGCCRRSVLDILCEVIADEIGFLCLGDALNLQRGELAAKLEVKSGHQDRPQTKVRVEGLWDDTEEGVFMERRSGERDAVLLEDDSASQSESEVGSDRGVDNE